MWLCVITIAVCGPQDDKDLVHEFVNHDGLECLIKVGSEADQNYQNYILRGELTLFLLYFYSPYQLLNFFVFNSE